jgi:SAM-dependent methyltransferase
MSEWIKDRKKSYFYNMRKFNNSVKRILYNKYCCKKSVLDLASGKGGDLNKLFLCNVKSVLGYDINEDSVKESNKRLKEYPQDFQNKVKYYNKDLCKEIILLSEPVDVVSCMFAFHYFIENFDIIIKSINKNLKKEGYFIGCCFDGNLIKERLNSPFLDNHFNIIKLNENEINVLLKETVLNDPEPEYLVDFSDLTEKMIHNGFKLIENKLFKDYYKDNFKMSETEKDVCFLNKTFVFKRCNPQKNE